MQRVKFIKSTSTNSKGSVITLSDEHAEKAIKMGHAIADDDIAGSDNKDGFAQIPHKRVTFMKEFKDGDITFPKGARMHVPCEIADKAIKAGAAKEFPIMSVGADIAAPIIEQIKRAGSALVV